MIASFFNRLLRYIAILGFLVYIVSPGISFLRGNGFIVNETGWILVIPYGFIILIREFRRYRSSLPRKELDL